MIQKHFSMKGIFVLLMAVSLVWACGEAKTPATEESTMDAVIVPDSVVAPIDTANAILDSTVDNRPSNRQK